MVQSATEFSANLVSPEGVGYEAKTRSFTLTKAARVFTLNLKSQAIKAGMPAKDVITEMDLKIL